MYTINIQEISAIILISVSKEETMGLNIILINLIVCCTSIIRPLCLTLHMLSNPHNKILIRLPFYRRENQVTKILSNYTQIYEQVSHEARI